LGSQTRGRRKATGRRESDTEFGEEKLGARINEGKNGVLLKHGEGTKTRGVGTSKQ